MENSGRVASDKIKRRNILQRLVQVSESHWIETPTLVTTDPAPTVLPRPTHTSKNSRTATNPNVILDIYLLFSLGAFQTTPHGGVHWVSCPVQANIRTEQCILPDHDELCVEDEKIEIPLADFEV